jgi:hypothetical protein
LTFGKFTLKFTQVDIVKMITEVTELMRVQLQLRTNVNFEVDIDQNIDTYLSTDE